RGMTGAGKGEALRIQRSICVLGFLAASLLAAAAADASLITIVVTATVFEVGEQSPQLQLSVGDTVSATMTIESSQQSYAPGPGEADIVYGSHHYQAPFNAFFADTSSGSGNSYATIYYDSDDGSNNIGLQLNSLIPPTAPNGGTAGEVPW